MVKNNASTSYDVTDKSITPLVRVGADLAEGSGVCVCGTSLRGTTLPKNSGTSKPLPASESPLQTACPPAPVPAFGVQQLQLCPWSQAAWAHTPAAGCGNCGAGSSDITPHP